MSAREIDKVLGGLPLSDKIGALILSLCAHNVDAIAAIISLSATVSVMGKNLRNAKDRQRCASCLRDVAAEVEAKHRSVVKDGVG